MAENCEGAEIVRIALQRCRTLVHEFFDEFLPRGLSFEEGRDILWRSIRGALRDLDATDPRLAEVFLGLDAVIFEQVIAEYRDNQEIEFSCPTS